MVRALSAHSHQPPGVHPAASFDLEVKMTASRSFAPRPKARDVAPPPPPVFPLLPYAYTAYAEHCSRDYADYVGQMAHADERPVAADEVLGLRMLSDMNQAFFSLVWAPMGAAIGRSRI
jgi:hypothetical protein